MTKPLYHCTSCGYTGYDTGWILKDHLNNILGHACPNDCKYGNDSPAEGQFIDLLEYDEEDDSVPDASAAEYEKALEAFHEFKLKEAFK